jgi:hypothetical protein
MSRNTYPLKLPTSVKKAAAELAATDGVSLNQFIAAAVAEKVGSLRAVDDFLRARWNGETEGHAQVSAPRTEGCASLVDHYFDVVLPAAARSMIDATASGRET